MITRIFSSEIWGFHFREGLFFELVIAIIRLRKSTPHANDRLRSIYQIVHVQEVPFPKFSGFFEEKNPLCISPISHCFY